jgi:hypothetical protein
MVPNDVGAVLTHRCDWDGSTVIAAHNFAPEPCRVTFRLDPEDQAIALVDLLDGAREELDPGTPEVELHLPRYGYRWLRLQREGQRLAP